MSNKFFSIDVGDIVSAAVAILIAVGIVRRNQNNGMLELDAATGKRLGLHGVDVDDKADVLAAWGHLAQAERMNLEAHLRTLPSGDRSMCISVLAAIPDDADQIRVLRSLARLPLQEFREATQAFRLVIIPDKTVDHIKRSLGSFYQWNYSQLRQKWPQIKTTVVDRVNALSSSIEGVNARLEQSNRKFARDIQERVEKRKQRGFFGRLTGTNIKF